MTISHRVGPLFTDHYELTMAAAFFEHQVFEEATFSLFIRKYPPRRNFFVAAGLEDVLCELESYCFSDNDVNYLKNTGLFSSDFISYLEQFHFSGQVFAMPEGTLFFANEPVLEVTAPVIEAQVIETFILNTIGFQTMIASKAARCIHAAQGRDLIDFSLRRTQGHDAGMKVARSTYIAGFAGTSNVAAGQVYEIPTSGTMAHSYIQTYKRELDAFRAYQETFPEKSVFLIDTYDTLEGAQNAVKVAKEMKKKGTPLVGVRLDSGDIAVLSQQVREILDESDLFDVQIFASSGFDEFKIAENLAKGAKIDAFGVGTKIGVSADAPYFDIVYKLVRFNERDVRKLSPGKATLAGEKQVFRVIDHQGSYLEDNIGLRDDEIDDAAPLLESVMKNGKIVYPLPSLQDIRNRFRINFSALNVKYKSMHDTVAFPVKLTPRLAKLQELS
jgi:nicotinate phosphoribosyltransferase